MPAQRIVKARKTHRCDSCGKPRAIQPGDRYQLHTVFPRDDTSGWGQPVQFRQCAACAARYGRPVEEPRP